MAQTTATRLAAHTAIRNENPDMGMSMDDGHQHGIWIIDREIEWLEPHYPVTAVVRLSTSFARQRRWLDAPPLAQRDWTTVGSFHPQRNPIAGMQRLWTVSSGPYHLDRIIWTVSSGPYHLDRIIWTGSSGPDHLDRIIVGLDHPSQFNVEQ